ncbi:N-acetylglutamate synthase ARgJ [Methanonatronarchaeum thermophilum]|uniref:Arginine biosynthesis bifunctional protein ArgJ n=1 Tax=Methanonatronarchaeum thermophilum TaxID=1927129 RepID=A0A1Y3GF36_9EURY|nr:bifunctional glutamate N-acetyltransferase/amino-acid acetyltransferase ArgJ [Methanonatronarchaeum thermophilum]OUJ18804.1 N-acetylglutamate synthase ARgJ [Methanonatronarchaeum thermophilum]
MSEKGICSVKGVKAYGFKDGKNGIAVISTPGRCVGTFTKNKVQAAPVVYSQNLLNEDPGIDNIIVNSGCANAFTGERGLKDARWMSKQMEGRNLVCSTGKIGSYLNRDWIQTAVEKAVRNIDTENGGIEAAKAIMTTDTEVKSIKIERDNYTVAGIAKGAGMIEPDMATMLAFIFTDIEIPQKEMENNFTKAVDNTFNMVVVDGDTSTNDTALLISTGKAEAEYTKNKKQVWKDIENVCKELAKKIAEDGEGSTKLIELSITNAKTEQEARKAAKTVLNSPLVKTAIYGEDPNFGRIVAALGRSKTNFHPEQIEIKINGKTVVKQGTINIDKEITEELKEKTIKIQINLNNGNAEIKGWGCDLTPEYIKINAEY